MRIGSFSSPYFFHINFVNTASICFSSSQPRPHDNAFTSLFYTDGRVADLRIMRTAARYATSGATRHFRSGSFIRRITQYYRSYGLTVHRRRRTFENVGRKWKWKKKNLHSPPPPEST